ncbi:MAG: tetratricopeptide repeat protein, partial [Pseudomonadota bacterium]
MISRVILLVIGLWLTTCANAALWKNLWFTPDQQGWQALKDKHPKKAAEQFTNKLWKGVALYRSGQYKQAVKFFAGFNTPLANYNRGNALAHLGDYKAAIDAYDLAIKQKPDFKDAIFNRDVLKKLMHQQKPQPQQKKSMENNQATTKNKQTKTQMSKTQSAKKKSASRNINNKNQQEANSSKSKEVSQAKSNPANEKNTTNTDKQE